MTPVQPRTDIASTDRRSAMVAKQIVARGVTDDLVIRAMLAVPRELFVPAESQREAYADGPLAIGAGQTISQPYIVARMLELLELRPGMRVLEIGTGTGYQAAVLAQIAGALTTVERHAELAVRAQQNLAALGLAWVDVRIGDGTHGAVDHAPYDAIVVAAGGPHVPPALVEQLAPGARLVCPVGPRDGQDLVRVTRVSESAGIATVTETFEPVRFVPLIGALGWSEGTS